MKENIKTLWVEALKSGKYAKTRSYLKDSKGYCCLGVLCDISGIDGFRGMPFEYLESDAVLPDQVKAWAGIKSSIAAFRVSNTECNSLAYINDKTSTFKEVIEAIETHWEKL